MSKIDTSFFTKQIVVNYYHIFLITNFIIILRVMINTIFNCTFKIIIPSFIYYFLKLFIVAIFHTSIQKQICRAFARDSRVIPSSGLPSLLFADSDSYHGVAGNSSLKRGTRLLLLLVTRVRSYCSYCV